VATRPDRTSDEYAVWLLALFQHCGLRPAEVDRCVIGTVVPAALYGLRRLCRDWFDCEPLIARSNLDWGFEIKVDRPGEVGADRLLNSLAAHQHYQGPLIVIDSGTATTFDVVAADGGFEGGVIAPGINLSMEALHAAAAKLPRVAIQKPARVIGKDTVGAMQAGVFWGYIALIEGLIARIKSEYPAPMTVVATGGVASLFHGATETIDHFDPDLTIRGLLEIHRRNSPKA
jgi:type III pantothenate kinase